MNVPFSAMITPEGTISFTHHDGRTYQILRSHLAYNDVLNLVRKLSHDPENQDLRNTLYDFSQPKRLIANSSDGRILIDGDDVTFDGKPADSFIAKRLIWIIEQGMNPEPLYRFLINLSENPSNQSVSQLYRFMDSNSMALTTDGMILAYKRVGQDFKDLYTHSMDNSVGQVVEMPRNEVNDDYLKTCSHGLHVCSMNYLPSYGNDSAGINRVVICEIHPRDVVSVPHDYNNAKMRVCRYTVMGEIKDATDILGSAPVLDNWSKDDDAPNLYDGDSPVYDLNDPLVLQFEKNGKWYKLAGHGCETEVEMLEYIDDNPQQTLRIMGSCPVGEIVNKPLDFSAQLKNAEELVRTAIRTYTAVPESYLNQNTKVSTLVSIVHWEDLMRGLGLALAYDDEISILDIAGHVMKAIP